ncbi:MAG: YfhO family protein, partial [Candidatus Latescibacteria bacterium]|nr:YfhO family protein [Candidatus Latescibacterota bacterium]
RDFCARALRAFSLPLWAPEINCGFPLFAEGQAGVLYPFNLLAALLLPTYAALNYNIILHLWLAGAGTYGFLRALGCLRVAALVGGLSSCCSGYLVVRAMSPNYLDVCAWMPVCLLLIELALQRGQWRLALGAALVIGAQWLAGHPQAALYSAGAGSFFALYRGWRLGGRPVLVLAVGVPLLGVGRAAVQLRPTAELVQVSSRGQGLSMEQFASMSLPPERLLTFLLPNFFGNDASGSYWGQAEGFFIQLCPYMGVVPLFLALVALRRRRDQYTCFFCVLACLALVLSLGHYTELFPLLYQIPGLKSFRIPTRFLLWLALAVAALAGLGLDQILRSPRRVGAGSWWAAALLGGVAVAMAGINGHVLWADAGELGRLGGAKLAALLHYQQELRGDLVRCLVLLGVGAAVASCQGREGWWRRAVPVVVVVAVFVDLYSFGASFNGVVDPQVYLRQPETATRIHEDAPTKAGMAPRLLSLVAEENSNYDWHGGWGVDLRSYEQYPRTLRMYTASLYGLGGALPGWSPLHLTRHWEFTRAYPGVMDLAGVQYVVSARPLSGHSLEAIADGEIKVYRNRTALPRAYLTPGYRVAPGARERLELLIDPAFDPRQQVVLETDPLQPQGPPGPAGLVTVSSYAPQEVQLEVEGGQGGMVVLSDTYYPGWRAFVDGQERPILQANHVFRAVPVAPGERQVVFRYQPDTFRQGLWLSGVAWVLLFALAWRFRGRTFPVPPAAGEPELGKARLWALQALLIVLVHAMVHQGPVWMASLERSRVLGN